MSPLVTLVVLPYRVLRKSCNVVGESSLVRRHPVTVFRLENCSSTTLRSIEDAFPQTTKNQIGLRGVSNETVIDRSNEKRAANLKDPVCPRNFLGEIR